MAKSKISAAVAVIAVAAVAAAEGDASYRRQLQMLIGNYDKSIQNEKSFIQLSYILVVFLVL